MDQLIDIVNDFMSFLQPDAALVYAGGIVLIGLVLVLWTLRRMRHFRLVFRDLRTVIVVYQTSHLSVSHLDEIARYSAAHPSPGKLLKLVEKRLMDNRNNLDRPRLSRTQVREYAHLLADIETRLPRYYWLDFFQYLSLSYAVFIGLLFLRDALQ